MKPTTSIIACIAILCSHLCHSQAPTPRVLQAKRTNQSVKIDGLITDEAWKDAAVMDSLVEFRPKIGAAEAYETRTVAYLMYDDEGIYFGGYCYERNKDSIATELIGSRDGFGTNDYIGLIFDTYKDNINGFEYFVTPLNEQWDAKMAPSNNDNGDEDFSWNAVWKSGAVIHNDGWSFEMFLPYAAIRFGKKDVQDWGLNITRRRRKTEQQFTWNPINPNVNGFLTQEGFWTGITNIKPPMRLQFSPYFSVYANHFPSNQPGAKNLTSQVNGGMDVKYGINQAFTLDATLIPDFGQVQSDNRVLNLGPFDVQFNEQRTFFTEGTELFSKGGLVYSRRLGIEPTYWSDISSSIGANETVIKTQTEAKLINATKISGRTQKGLGIGILNGITRARTATVENTVTKEQREVEVDPLANYNVLVFDQTLKNNSNVTLINTNVWRSGKAYDANVTAALFSFNDKKNTWNVSGQSAVSNLVGYGADGKTETGYSQQLGFGKTSGRFNFRLWQQLADTKYTNRDMGYFTNNNFLDHGYWFGYRWVEPKSFYNRIFINTNFSFSRLLKPIDNIDQLYQQSNVNYNMNIQSKKLWWVGMFTNYIFRGNDFYEPRREGYFFRRGSSLVFGGWFESNEAKKYSFNAELFTRTFFNFYKGFSYELSLRQNYRFNNKLTVSHRFSTNPLFNNVGYASVPGNNDVNFARRKRNTIENIIFVKYSFTNMMGLTFRARHYLSTVENKQFYFLQQDGKLKENPNFISGADQNFNLFNIDMVYTWQFAPGSFINIVWKDAVEDFTRSVESSYFKNFGRTMEAPDNNNISLKVIYFLDYLTMKQKLKKKAKE